MQKLCNLREEGTVSIKKNFGFKNLEINRLSFLKGVMKYYIRQYHVCTYVVIQVTVFNNK